MKRNIPDLLDAYIDESVDLNGNTPLSPSRIKELTMSKIDQKSTAKKSEQNASVERTRIRKPISRSLLITAVIVSFCCLTAFAIAFSLRDTARMDMGIPSEAPIPEWKEYNNDEKTGEDQKDNQAILLATMCSGKQLYAYFEVSPIPEEIAAILADNTSPQYEWDLSGTNTANCKYHVEQTGYDPETQTALVKVHVHGEDLETIGQVELRLALTHNLKDEAIYGPVVIPVTSSQSISCPADVAVVNTKAHFDMVWGMRPEPLNIPDYTSQGRIHRISIYAGYIEVELETPDITRWTAESNTEQIDIEVPPGLEDQNIRNVLFCNNWFTSVNEALKGATLNYKDGTVSMIDELPRDYAAVWHLDSGHMDSVYEGKQIYRFIPKQAIDLSTIESVTICGTEYSFIPADEIEF